MQFAETNSKTGKCPICGKSVPVRSVRDVRDNKPSYCSRVCASQARFNSRYSGTLAGPYNRPTLIEKTKFEQVLPEEK
jgi:hypothetical protein